MLQGGCAALKSAEDVARDRRRTEDLLTQSCRQYGDLVALGGSAVDHGGRYIIDPDDGGETGGQGTVRRAVRVTAMGVPQPGALKTARLKGDVGRGAVEASLGRALRHPNVVATLAADVRPGKVAAVLCRHESAMMPDGTVLPGSTSEKLTLMEWEEALANPDWERKAEQERGLDMDVRVRLPTVAELRGFNLKPDAVLSWDVRIFMQRYPVRPRRRPCCARASELATEPHAPSRAGSLAKVIEKRAMPTQQPDTWYLLVEGEPRWPEPPATRLKETGRALLSGAMLDVPGGLEHLQDMRLLHCDVKPENALCHVRTPEEQGERAEFLDVRVADLGLAGVAKVMEDGSLKRPRVVGIGTPGAMAPELFGARGCRVMSATRPATFSLWAAPPSRSWGSRRRSARQPSATPGAPPSAAGQLPDVGGASSRTSL